MRKIPVIIGRIFGVLILLGIIAVAVSPEGQKSFEQGFEQGKQTIQNSPAPTEAKSEPTQEPKQQTAYTLSVQANVEDGKIKVKEGYE